MGGVGATGGPTLIPLADWKLYTLSFRNMLVMWGLVSLCGDSNTRLLCKTLHKNITDWYKHLANIRILLNRNTVSLSSVSQGPFPNNGENISTETN